MIGLLTKKYHVAILDEGTDGFVNRVIGVIRTWYSGKVIIKTYTDVHELFEAANLNRERNKPFDLTILCSKKDAERMILEQSNPNMKVIVCNDEKMPKLPKLESAKFDSIKSSFPLANSYL